jgi:hypothetical protein
MATVQEPKRIISARILARRLEISSNTLSKHIRRELVRPDFESDCGSFFDPARLPQLKRAIAENRQRNWRERRSLTKKLSLFLQPKNSKNSASRRP